MNPAVVLTAFVVVFPAELPDKTMVATLVLGTRFRPLPVFVGAAAGFTVQVALSVAIGQAFTLLPKRWVDVAVAVLFAVGAAILLLGKEKVADVDEQAAGAGSGRESGSVRIGFTAFTVVALAEFGDLTQIATANLAAKYNSPFSVGVGALAALWAVAAIALIAGRALLRVVPLVWVRRAAGVIMAALAVFTAIEAIRA